MSLRGSDSDRSNLHLIGIGYRLGFPVKREIAHLHCTERTICQAKRVQVSSG